MSSGLMPRPVSGRKLKGLEVDAPRRMVSADSSEKMEPSELNCIAGIGVLSIG